MTMVEFQKALQLFVHIPEGQLNRAVQIGTRLSDEDREELFEHLQSIENDLQVIDEADAEALDEMEVNVVGVEKKIKKMEREEAEEIEGEKGMDTAEEQLSLEL